MKTINKVLLTAMILILTILTGCTENILTPNKEITGTGQKNDRAVHETRQVKGHQSKVELKQHEIFTLNYTNTGFYNFDAISVVNNSATQSALEIIGYSDDEAFLLGSNSKGFWVSSITIENKSPGNVSLDVYVTGSKYKIKTSDKEK